MINFIIIHNIIYHSNNGNKNSIIKLIRISITSNTLKMTIYPFFDYIIDNYIYNLLNTNIIDYNIKSNLNHLNGNYKK